MRKIVVVNGVVCAIQLCKASTKSRYGREYARFDVNNMTRKGKVALWAMRSGRAIKVYVIPLTHLRNVSSVYLPVDGKYARGWQQETAQGLDPLRGRVAPIWQREK